MNTEKIKNENYSCCIIIPLYKEVLNKFEEITIQRNLKIFNDRKVFFICSEKLDLKKYNCYFGTHDRVYVEKFADSYFTGINGYNTLMLNPLFYKRFIAFDYMLVCQTDAYVFLDNLSYWCEKNYDYIGGLIFENYTGDPDQGAKLWVAGNGGFSLRKTAKIYSLLSSIKPLLGPKALLKEVLFCFPKAKKQFIKKLFLLPLTVLGYKNHLRYYAKNFPRYEDVFFIELNVLIKTFYIPSVLEAVYFSWDRCPDYLYRTLNNLPMACHAWYRNDYPYEGNLKFWSNFIETGDRG